jgi:hypothetical protein
VLRLGLGLRLGIGLGMRVRVRVFHTKEAVQYIRFSRSWNARHKNLRVRVRFRVRLGLRDAFGFGFGFGLRLSSVHRLDQDKDHDSIEALVLLLSCFRPCFVCASLFLSVSLRTNVGRFETRCNKSLGEMVLLLLLFIDSVTKESQRQTYQGPDRERQDKTKTRQDKTRKGKVRKGKNTDGPLNNE